MLRTEAGIFGDRNSELLADDLCSLFGAGQIAGYDDGGFLVFDVLGELCGGCFPALIKGFGGPAGYGFIRACLIEFGFSVAGENDLALGCLGVRSLLDGVFRTASTICRSSLSSRLRWRSKILSASGLSNISNTSAAFSLRLSGGASGSTAWYFILRFYSGSWGWGRGSCSAPQPRCGRASRFQFGRSDRHSLACRR